MRRFVLVFQFVGSNKSITIKEGAMIKDNTSRLIGKIAWLFILISLTATGSAFAKRAYVSDETVEINIRTGPSLQNKIIALLKVGDPVEFLGEESGWAKVRLQDGREGWTLKKYLMNRLPWKIYALKLEETNKEMKQTIATLKEENSDLRKHNKELSQNLARTKEELNRLKNMYSELKAGASNYLSLKKSYDELAEKSKVMETELKKLKQENERIRYSQNIRWFLSGAAVLVLGWLVGLQMGKAKSRRRSRLYYD